MSAASWKVFLEDLKKGEVKKGDVRSGIADGLPSLDRVFARGTKKLKNVITDAIRNIFYASSRKKAMEMFGEFKSC